MSTSAICAPPRARALEFVPDAFVVHLLDGRSLTVPIEWFPRLRDATPEQRSRYEFSGQGYAIHWPELEKKPDSLLIERLDKVGVWLLLDEDISVPGLLGLPD